MPKENEQEFLDAVEDGDVGKVGCFLEERTPPKETLTLALSRASTKTNYNILSALLSNGAEITRFAVNFAARTKSIPIFELFLTHGWNINDCGVAILRSFVKDAAFTTWLLDHGADPNVYDSGMEGCRCALDTAAVKSTTAMVSLLVNRGASLAGAHVLHAAVGRRDGEMIPMLEHLLNLGADIDAVEYASNPEWFHRRFYFGLGTPLHEAIKKGKVEAVRFLLERGANPYIKNTRGSNAFQMARAWGRTACLAALEDPPGGVRRWRNSPFRSLEQHEDEAELAKWE